MILNFLYDFTFNSIANEVTIDMDAPMLSSKEFVYHIYFTGCELLKSMITYNKTNVKTQREEEFKLFHCIKDDEIDLDILALINVPIVVAIITVLLFIYFCYIRTINWTKDLSDVGYDIFWENKLWASRSYKKVMVDQVKRLRKIGELPPVYPNGWFVLLESSDVKTSEVKYVSALGENFAVFRTETGEIKILDAYCTHLGANMAIGGKVIGDCLECPFHGWKFNGDSGECVEIPYTNCKIPKAAKVKTWLVQEIKDFIFVWYHSEGQEPSWSIRETPEITKGQWKYRGRNEFTVCAHIQEIPENGADVAHLNAIHAPSMLSGTDIRFYDKWWLRFCKHNWFANWIPSDELDSKHIATINLKHEMKFFDKFTMMAMDVLAKQIGPGYVELSMKTPFGPILVTQSVTPIESMLQKIIHRVYCPPSLAPYANLILFGETIMVGRDIMVWNHKKFIKNPLLVKEDHRIQLFRRWYSQFYSDNSPKFKFQIDDMGW